MTDYYKIRDMHDKYAVERQKLLNKFNKKYPQDQRVGNFELDASGKRLLQKINSPPGVWTDDMDREREDLLSNKKYTPQQQLDGMKTLYERQWNIKIPKTAKCECCKTRDVNVEWFIDEDGELQDYRSDCVEECIEAPRKRQEA